MSIRVSDVSKSGWCLGCGLCVSMIDEGANIMQMNEKGYLVPDFSGFDIEPHIPELQSFCPGISIVLDEPLKTKQERLYGPYREIKIAFAKDEKVRHLGSSGGVLTALTCELLKAGAVDGVLQVGACSNDSLRSVSHFSKTVDEVMSNAGSRYAPSSLLEHFKQILDSNSKIAIVGKPCDVAAVRQFLRLHTEYSDKVYCILSFFCMGLPSQIATGRLVESLGFKDKTSVSYIRYRGNGWPGLATVIDKSGSKKSLSYEESWGNILGRDVMFRCKICPDGWGSFADIAVGDGWHISGDGPSFEEKSGRSVLFVRNQRGKELLEVYGGALVLDNYDVRELPLIQKSQYERKNRAWVAYLALKIGGDKLLRFRGLGMWSRVFSMDLLTLYRETRGIIKRISQLK